MTDQDFIFRITLSGPEFGAIIAAAIFAILSHGGGLHPMVRLGLTALSAAVAYVGLKFVAGIN